MNEQLEPVRVGEQAPEVKLTRAEGEPTDLAALYSRGPLALLFLRHLG